MMKTFENIGETMLDMQRGQAQLAVLLAAGIRRVGSAMLDGCARALGRTGIGNTHAG